MNRFLRTAGLFIITLFVSTIIFYCSSEEGSLNDAGLDAAIEEDTVSDLAIQKDAITIVDDIVDTLPDNSSYDTSENIEDVISDVLNDTQITSDVGGDTGCTNECSKVGDKKCADQDSYQECIMGSNGCLIYGDPVKCNQPPKDYCVSSKTLRNYNSNGTCNNNACSYSYTDKTCDYKCQNAECITCTPDCTNKECGDDGCGGSCGECDEGYVCNNSGKCEKDTGPFSNFTLYRNVCEGEGYHLWARWNNKFSFEMEGYVVYRPDNTKMTKSFYDVPGFYAGYDDVWLLDETGPSPSGKYLIEFNITANNISQKIEVESEVTDGLYKDNTLLTLVKASKGDLSNVILTVKPKFNGTVQRVMVYEGNGGCFKTKMIFYEEPALMTGYSTEIDIGSINANTGENLIAVIEGVNNDTNYSFYSTVEFQMPDMN